VNLILPNNSQLRDELQGFCAIGGIFLLTFRKNTFFIRFRWPSVNFRLAGCWSELGFQKIEIAAFLGRPDVLQEQVSVTALVTGWRRLP
jgi:hypothetical protein